MAIQIIREILGGRYDVLSHRFYLQFETPFSVLLDMIIFVRQQDLASKDTFLLLHLTVQGKLGLKVSNLKQKSVTRGGGGAGKVRNKCHVLFE